MTAYMRCMRAIWIFFSIMMLLAGCSFLSPVKMSSSNKYLINTLPDCVPIKRPRSIVLLVNKPYTAPIYNTVGMAYTIRPYQISYFSLNQWAETPDEMFHPLLVKTMENTHHFKAIATPPYTGRYDYVLNTDILELLQDYRHCPALLRMRVRAQIIKASTNQIIGSREFSVIQPIPQRGPYAGVFAANDASAHILQRIAYFSLEKM